MEDENKYKKKIQRNSFKVVVSIDLVCGDTISKYASDEIREQIIQLSVDFLGKYKDVDLMRILGLSYSTYYYHKKHIKRAKYRRKEEEND